MLIVGMGVLLGWAGFWLDGNWPAVGAKLRGDAPDCPWGMVLRAYRDNKTYDRIARALETDLSVERRDASLGIELIRSSGRSFWIKEGAGDRVNGRRLLAHLLVEHSFLGETNSADMVRHGDVVLDCGAHIGVFTHFALQRGASLVVAVEPEPTNAECLRRNFGPELVAKRVVLVEKGVWDYTGRLTLHESTLNSGSNTFIGEEGGRTMEVPVMTIDRLVEELHLPRVDYIKMDIEGSEREALKGARGTLGRYRPRLMLDAYHQPEDPVVLPAIIREAHSGYRETCGPCDLNEIRLIPHAIFFHP